MAYTYSKKYIYSMTEVWKDIEGYEGLYQISNLGRVKSLEKYSYSGGGMGLHQYHERILKQGKGSRGYFQVSIKGKTYSVHRLVADAFIPNPDNLPCVNHKDENKQNNTVWNLEWCTTKHNVTYGNAITKRSIKRSKTVYQYSIDGQLIVSHISVSEAARKLGFQTSHICNCCNGKIESAYGYKWSYELGSI